jgi:multiple sugar transport system ATP-binding protein
MGRAIIREPVAFLMDEPLSNLDAKLRVGMRTSLQQLHSRLRTTTVYVTHDQVEAMTLGQRVAVMRDGFLQQVDVPQRLYEDPANVFVAAFIGSPSMNLLPATIAGDTASVGSWTIPLDRDRRPADVRDGQVTAGLRPEAFEDAAFADGSLPSLDVRVEVVEELGSDTFVFFKLDVDPIVVEEAVSDNADEDATTLTAGDRGLVVARVNSRTKAKVGEEITLVVDPSRLYFFSPESGESLLRGRAAAASAG